MQTSEHLLGDFQTHCDSKMPQHPGSLLLPFRAEHAKRLHHLPLASKRSLECEDFVPATGHIDLHVLVGSHVSFNRLCRLQDKTDGH